ncbi:MAG: hypothetical protein H0W58_07405 [Acidobacteria bacterium]|jgi:hypothetical protein|nr:hypothetical protein [Acidobacteriota bacterium]
MKKQCNAKNKSGEPCSASASENGFCFTHDVTKGAERAIARRNGGLRRITPSVADKSLVPKVTRTITDVMTILDYALQESLVLQNSISRGRLLVSIAHGYIEALKVGEMEQRLEAVEMTLKMRKEQKK